MKPAALERAVFAVCGVAAAPLVLDSSDPLALERGLKAADGKVLINSVSGESKSQAVILPLARKYGAAVIGLALDESGIPSTAAGRVAIAGKILHAALDAGLPRHDVIIDCLTLTVSAEQAQVRETLQRIAPGTARNWGWPRFSASAISLLVCRRGRSFPQPSSPWRWKPVSMPPSSTRAKNG